MGSRPGLVSICLMLSAGCNSHTRDITGGASEPTGARVVPQVFPGADVLGIAKGGRFAVLTRAVIDLETRRVAHLIDGEVLALGARDDQLVLQRGDDAIVLDLLRGRETVLPGHAFHLEARRYLWLIHGRRIEMFDLARESSSFRTDASLRGTPRAGTRSPDGRRAYVCTVSYACPHCQIWGQATIHLAVLDASSGQLLSETALEPPGVNGPLDPIFVFNTDGRGSLRVAVGDPSSGDPRGAVLEQLFDPIRAAPLGLWERRQLSEPLRDVGAGLVPLRSEEVPRRVADVLRSLPTTAQPAIARAISPDGTRFVTGGGCAWSLREARRERCDVLVAVRRESWSKSLFATPVRFADRERVVVMGIEPDHPDAYPNRMGAVGIWDPRDGRQVFREHRPLTWMDHDALSFAPTGLRYLVLLRDTPGPRPDERRYPLETWTVGGEGPDWRHPGCSAPPRWCEDGRFVSCGSEVLRADSGRPLPAGSRETAATTRAARAEELTSPCGGRFGWSGDFSVGRPGSARRPVASFFDLGERDWAVVTPDGYFSGTTKALRSFAWYRDDGSLLDGDAIRRLRRRDVVRARLERARKCRGRR